eukprot:SAG11_NODE_2224_length_3666_cov_2.269975_3_plen_53_part_00
MDLGLHTGNKDMLTNGGMRLHAFAAWATAPTQPDALIVVRPYSRAATQAVVD